MIPRFRLLPVLLTILLLGFPTYAEDSSESGDSGEPGKSESESPPVYDMGNIVVVGEAPPVETVSSTVIPIEECDTKLKEDVTQAVREAPGMYVTTGSKNQPRIMMRGLAQERALVLYDGVPIQAPYYSDVDASEIPLDNTAQIQIVRGNASVLYGPNALAGVINLSSVKPDDRLFRALLSVDQEANTFGRVAYGDRAGGLYYQLSAGFRNSDGWRMSDDFHTTYDEDGNVLEDGGIRNHSAFSQWSAGAKIGREWDDGEISLTASYIDSEKDLPTTTDPEGSIRYWDFPTWRMYSTILAGRAELSEDLDFRANLFYHNYDNVLRNYRDSTYTDLRWESTYDDYSTGVNARLGWTACDQFTLRTAFNGVLDDHKTQSDIGDPWEHYTAKTWSLATEGEIVPAEDLTLQAGIAYEVYNFGSVDSVVGDASAIARRTRDVNDLAYGILAEYKLADTHRLTAAISQKNRFPNMSQLFGNIEEFTADQIGTLESEQALEYSAGWAGSPSKSVNAGITAYYYDVTNMIERPNRDALYDNIDHADFLGAELWGEVNLESGFSGRLAYTHQSAEGSMTGAGDSDLPFVPDDLLQLTAGYRFSFGTSVTAGIQYTGEATEYPDEAPVTIPCYALFDLSVAHDFSNGLGLILRGDNLLDKDYYTEVGYPQPGRTIRLAIRYTL